IGANLMIWITGALVYDVHRGGFDALDVGVAGDRIERLVEQGSARPTAGEAVIDADGTYLLPGLIDCHVHLTVDSTDADPSAGASKPDQVVAAFANQAAERTLRAGVTSVRDLGGSNYLEMALREAVERGDA